MKTLLGTLLLLLVASSVQAGQGCFEKHIREAIELNRERRELYIELDKRSRGVSNGLIFFEKLILPFAKIYDKRAAKYQNEGINLFCDDLVDMAQTPTYKPHTSQIPNGFILLQKRQIMQARKDIYWAYKVSGWRAVLHAVDFHLKTLSEQPSYYCLTRHFLESVGRSAALAPGYIEQAREKGLENPDKLLWKFVKLQLRGLNNAYRLDVEAAPMQEKRIPILCNDVPHIPIPRD